MIDKSVMRDDMEQILQIEQACALNNHEAVMSVMGSIESYDMKKQAFLKIIEYHEERSRFPVGYLLLFIRWLLQNNDRKTAMEYILRCRQNGVDEARLSDLIYETVIKPEELLYKERFNRNLQLLIKNGVLISGRIFDFEQIKKQVLMVANFLNPVPDMIKKDLFNKEKIFLILDVVDMELVAATVNARDFTYLVYDNVQMLYYLFLFEDLSGLSMQLEQKKVVVFDGMDEKSLKDFFLDLAIIVPSILFGMTGLARYDEIVSEIRSMRAHKISLLAKALDVYYEDHDHQYYRELFSKEPSEIKVLLITSETTEINKFITRNWHEAFLELGYITELLIEKRPFERTTNHNVSQVLHEFKPDMIFMINWTASGMIEKGETLKNILWINRYRDSLNNELHHAKPGYEYNNMFILPVLFEWAEELKDIGIPENRIFNTSDGVNISVFTKKAIISRQYACDIVSVNNAVGSESFRMDYYLRSIKNEAYKKVIMEMVDELTGTFSDEQIVFCMPNSHDFIDKIEKKLLEHGGNLSADGKIYLDNFFIHLMDSLCRGKIMEWIVDSGITSNIKLWGKGWPNIDKFKKYHMGIARHGDQLSSIYQGGKISISDNLWSLHERNYEIFAGGGFPLIRYVELPEVENSNKITNHFRENEEVVMFYSRDDLLNKIQYYLDNPEEREAIAEKGRQVVINNFSHVAIVKKTMDFIKDYYKD